MATLKKKQKTGRLRSYSTLPPLHTLSPRGFGGSPIWEAGSDLYWTSSLLGLGLAQHNGTQKMKIRKLNTRKRKKVVVTPLAPRNLSFSMYVCVPYPYIYIYFSPLCLLFLKCFFFISVFLKLLCISLCSFPSLLLLLHTYLHIPQVTLNNIQ